MIKKILFIFLLFITLLVTVWFRNTDISKAQNYNQNVTLQAESTKESYILGETIKLEITLANKLDKPMRVPSVENGYLHIWIATSDQKFKEYRGSNWGNKDGGKGVKAGETFKTQITLLWNQTVPQNPTVMKDRLNSDYVFSRAGVYFIKVTGTIWDNDQKTIIESELIQIVADEPVGDDLIIWGKIKNNGEFAYFMQEGDFIMSKADFLTSKAEEKEKLQKEVKEVEEISAKYPNSILGKQMKTSLEKYQATDAQRKEFRQQYQNNQEKKP